VDGTNRKLMKPSRSRQLLERATFCKRLAVGAADPSFAATLQTLADEYEGEAARVETQTATRAVSRGSAEAGGAYPDLTG
jgi:hypothetical protein